jgi:hypothetical protein
MKFFPVVLISTALAVTACTGTATIPGSSVGSVTRTVHLNAAPNADQDISDLGNRPNPPIHKGVGGVPVASAPARPVIATKPALPTSPVRDRCSNETGRPGKALPMCLPA